MFSFNECIHSQFCKSPQLVVPRIVIVIYFSCEHVETRRKCSLKRKREILSLKKHKRPVSDIVTSYSVDEIYQQEDM